MLDEFKQMIEDRQTGSIKTDDEVIENSTGKSRGKGSISVLGYLHEMIEINDELTGYRGTVRKENLLRTLDGYEAQGVVFGEIGPVRDRRADWQNLNDSR